VIGKLLGILGAGKNQKKPGVSHLSTIGFHVADVNEFGMLGVYVKDTGETIEKRDNMDGFYKRLCYPNGVELWVYLKDGLICNLEPHFRGIHKNPVRVVKGFQDPKDEYSGVFEASAGIDPTGKDQSGELPLVFSCPSFAIHSQEKLPKIVDLSVTVFSSKINVFKNVDEFHKKMKDFAPNFYIPTGTFDPTTNKLKEPPEPHQWFAGEVKEAKKLINPKTGIEFYWMSVETLVMPLDVLADRRLIDNTPENGNIVEVHGWFTGDWIGLKKL